jgi:hypothetical protein
MSGYLVTIDGPDIDGIIFNNLDDALIMVGRLIELLSIFDSYKDKFIYIIKYVLIDGQRHNITYNRYSIKH